jgi:hypothetical protein
MPSTLVVPKYRTYTSDAVQPDPLALSLLDRVQPEYSRTWDLIPFAAPLTRLDYKMASRAPEGNTVVSTTKYTTGSSTTITFNADTKDRLTAGHLLYHPATKQVFVIDSYVVSTGVVTLEQVNVIGGAAAADVAIGETYYRIGQAENYDDLNATSRVGVTSTEENYIQENTERLDFSLTFLRQPLKWGINKQMLIDERMEEYVKDLNLNILYGITNDETSTERARTTGFDHVVSLAGNDINANSLGTADIEDLAGAARFLQDNGAGSSAGTVFVARPDVYDEYDTAGLQDFTPTIAPEDAVFLGTTLKGITVRGVRYPFYADPTIVDKDVRVISTKYARKAYYQDESGQVWSPRIVPENSLSNFKNEVNFLTQRWGTLWMNADKVHAKIVTGL